MITKQEMDQIQDMMKRTLDVTIESAKVIVAGLHDEIERLKAGRKRWYACNAGVFEGDLTFVSLIAEDVSPGEWVVAEEECYLTREEAVAVNEAEAAKKGADKKMEAEIERCFQGAQDGCVKCGCKDAYYKWVEGTGVPVNQLEKRCMRCGYTWWETPLDAKETT